MSREKRVPLLHAFQRRYRITYILSLHAAPFLSRYDKILEKTSVPRLLLAYCTSESPEPSLLSKCSLLTSDATLVSLFRTGAAPLPCPIKGPLEFTYSQGEGECNSPRSRAEACTQESRLLLRYQACANVHSSESVGQYSSLAALIISPYRPTRSSYPREHAMEASRKPPCIFSGETIDTRSA